MLIREEGIYTLVADYYEARILMGFYQAGERLPSLTKICAMFDVAPATARAGLNVLEKKGYIKVTARKAPLVIYDVSLADRRYNAACYFSARLEDILDLGQSGRLLFEPLWALGMRNLNDNDWRVLLQALENPSSEALSMPVQLYIVVLGTFNNHLLVNLYWETIRYIRFPYLSEPVTQKVRQLAQSEDSLEIVVQKLQMAFVELYDQSIKELVDFVETARQEYDLSALEDVPFHWKVYRPRPQLCYSLVAKVIQQIGHGHYLPGDYLPSQPEMAEELGVSVSTVRRALKILISLGLVQSYQGKGTQVGETVTHIDFTDAEVLEGLRYYLESVQFMQLTFVSVMRYTLEISGESGRQLLAEQFTNWLGQGKSHMAFNGCLSFIEENCPLNIVRECYSRLRELLAWGYAFTCYRLQKNSLHETYNRIFEQVAEDLRQQDWQAFSEDLQTLFNHEESEILALMEREQVTFE